ncbi:hypothetical protein DFQ27_001622, partial [Actinomortierella ambigua]
DGEDDGTSGGPTFTPPTFDIRAEHINKISHTISTRERRKRRVKRQNPATKAAYQEVSKAHNCHGRCRTLKDIHDVRIVRL